MTGLFGGAFDPPHNGHVALARAAVDHFALERLVIAPAGEPPLKAAPVGADAETRLQLTEAAFRDLPRMEVSRIDVDRPQPAYSHDTVRVARERWGEIVFLIGADRLADFPHWKAPKEVLRYARLGVATRPGIEPGALQNVLRALAHPDRIELFEIPCVDVSSHEIRRRVAAGEPIAALVPAPVAALIDELALYRH